MTVIDPSQLKGTEHPLLGIESLGRRRPFGSRWGRVGSSVQVGMVVGTGGALGLFAMDVVSLAHVRSDVGTSKWLTGLACTLFVALTSALALGALVGALFASWAEGAIRNTLVFYGRIRRGERAAHRTAIARIVTATLLLPACSFCGYRISLVTLSDLARPTSIAAALATSHLGLAAALTLAWRPLEQALARGTDRMRASPRVGMLVESVTPLAIVWGVLFSVAAITAWVLFPDEISLLPWSDAAALVPAVTLALAMGYWARRRQGPPSWLTVVLPGAFLLVLLTGGVAMARLTPRATAVRQLAFERARSGHLGYAVWTWAFDFDRDGQLSMLGGGDCAPFDSRRYLGAVDLPDNGIDEDCDGADLSAAPLLPKRRTPGLLPTLLHRPTIVLVTIDGLSAGRLASIGGGDTPVMPHTDELARRSVLFRSAFSEGPSTRLSFPSMFTSRWDSQLTHQFAPRHPYPLAPSEKQLQDILTAAGYETMAIIPNPYFDKEHWSSMTRGFLRVDVSPMGGGPHNAPAVTDAAIRALNEPHDRPLYLWVHYFDAHGPYLAIPGATYATTSDVSYHEAELGFIDNELARLFRVLDARTDPAYLLLTADHGSVFRPAAPHGPHYGYDLYTATLHVPLVIRGPNLAQRRIDELASLMDVAPTILDLAGVEEHSEFEGTSLVAAMTGVRSDADRNLFHEFYLPERDFRGEDPLSMVAVRSPNWNLVLDRTKGHYELYDWKTDYLERHDLYEEQAMSPDIVHLRSLLGAFLQQVHRRPPGAALLALP